MSRGRFEIVRTNAGHHVRIVGANGEPLAASEVLSSVGAAEQNVDAIIGLVEDEEPGTCELRYVDERTASGKAGES